MADENENLETTPEEKTPEKAASEKAEPKTRAEQEADAVDAAKEKEKKVNTGKAGTIRSNLSTDTAGGVIHNKSLGFDDGNIFVFKNDGSFPLVNYNFMVRVEAMFDLPCRSVKAFTRENQYERIQEGGLNDYVHIRRKPISEPFTFEIERYTCVDYFDPLPNGAEPILPIIVFVWRKAQGNVFPNRTYTFTGCTVMKKTYGELNAEQSGLLIETTTIAYREFACIEMPWFNDGV